MDRKRFDEAIHAFDDANWQDSQRESTEGESYPREWLYARWLSEWVTRLQPDASEELRLAARCQHIERWKIPRDHFPQGRKGYLDWRASLARFHAQRAGEILARIGYCEQVIERVRDLNLKKNLEGDPETQIIEDALCLVFLEKQFHEFAGKTETSKVVRILRRTWRKMSPRARQVALTLHFDAGDRKLIDSALGSSVLSQK